MVVATETTTTTTTTDDPSVSSSSVSSSKTPSVVVHLRARPASDDKGEGCVLVTGDQRRPERVGFGKVQRSKDATVGVVDAGAGGAVAFFQH